MKGWHTIVSKDNSTLEQFALINRLAVDRDYRERFFALASKAEVDGLSEHAARHGDSLEPGGFRDHHVLRCCAGF